ncbi:MAG: QueT transporter family protein, partial [candidate division Zixibacteria bacterium]|nr:QueT transporter family protein [candidate division Zixibacteria bacterium]
MDLYNIPWYLESIILIILGLITAIIARRRGRNFWIWWLFGSLTLILALIFVLILEPKKRKIEKRLIATREYRRCPFCAELVNIEAKVCLHCNREISPAGEIPEGESISQTTKYISQVGIIASLYAVITIALAPISYGPIQVRISEALTILPYLTPAAIPGLFIGCVVANVYGGLGIYDIVGGSLCTLLAAFLTFLSSRTKKPLFAPLPPVLVNAFGVSLYLH